MGLAMFVCFFLLLDRKSGKVCVGGRMFIYIKIIILNVRREDLQLAFSETYLLA